MTEKEERAFFENLKKLAEEQNPDRPEQPGDVDKKIRAALFDAEMGSQSWTSGDLTDEQQKAFHDQIRAFHAKDGSGRVTIGSLIGEHDFPDPDEVTNQGHAIDLINRVLPRLVEQHVYFPPPKHVPPLTLYRWLVTDLLNHEIPAPSAEMPAMIPFDTVATELELPSEMTVITEAFLLALFNLSEPLPEDMFFPTMRLHGEVAPRAEALAHANAWRAQWAEINPLTFAPGPVQEGQDGVQFQMLQVIYEGVRPDGSRETFDGPGVVQIAPSPRGWLIQGGMIEGFEF